MTPNNKKHILSNKKNCSSCSVTAVTYLSNYFHGISILAFEHKITSVAYFSIWLLKHSVICLELKATLLKNKISKKCNQ